MDSMDTGAAADPAVEGIALIKAQMPKTYESIQARAAQAGNVAYTLVRRGLRGEANCFWACERGCVVGTPFFDNEISRDIAQLMVQFGSTYVCIWGKEGVTGEANGAN
jgi:hypothetical protein